MQQIRYAPIGTYKHANATFPTLAAINGRKNLVITVVVSALDWSESDARDFPVYANEEKAGIAIGVDLSAFAHDW